MENFNKCAIIALLMIPNSVFAVTECNYVEFSDHFEAVCSGDEKFPPASVAKAPVTERTTALPAASADKNVAAQDQPTVSLSAKGLEGRAIHPDFSSRGKRITREIVDAKQAIRMKNIQMKK